jgi:hypothetical protein
MLATIVEETVAVLPSGFALKFALALPVVARLSIAVLDTAEMKSCQVNRSAVETCGVRALSVVVLGPLATSLPEAVLINA